MLRGPQTSGELRTRSERLHAFGSADEVHAALDRLIERELVRRLERRPGQREERYEQLLGASVPSATPAEAPPEAEAPAPADPAADGLAQRVERLERELVELRRSLDTLRGELGA
jgi:hypothetical protein